VAERLPAPELPAWLLDQLPFERYCLQIEGHRIHVMEAGDPAGRPILAVHGNPTWGYLYRKVATELEGSGLRILMPDLVGMGLSSKPDDPSVHQLENHSRWIGGVIDALDLTGIVCVGQDWGGPIGLLALADRPERSAGLVILNTVIGPPRPGFQPTLFHRFSRWPGISSFAFRRLGFPQRWMHVAQGDRSSIRGIVKRSYLWPLRRYADNVGPLALARMVPDSMEHPSIAPLLRCRAFVEGFAGPTAMVWGNRDPVLGKLKRRIHRAMPEAPLTETEAGHFLQEEVPAEIAAAIRGVCRRLDSTP
jgi:haloalkane dehalogenase